MEKIIEGMGKIEFGRFYNNENKIISSLDESPIIDSKKIQTISSVQLKELLDNDYIFNLISHRNKIIVYSTNPINLLSKYRFDIFVKYYYVKSYIENYDLKEAKKIYLSHIKAFNNFHEPDGRKNNAKDFIIKFNSLIENIKSCKNLDKTIIPISTTGIPIDGAHRIAIALYFDLKIQYCVFDLLDGKYDEIFFLQRGMPYKYVQEIKDLSKKILK
ncbi:MAG: hypothetical protein ACLSD2_04420 [Clostridia bacterium]|jgi:hypothetical protein|nr:hypothetical protein [Clostridia bacterium]MBP8633975.1 hypothetical protein [Clostridia bacterium]